MWVVDTCVLLDIGIDDPRFSRSSLAAIKRRRAGGLVISPVTYVELAPHFGGDRQEQDVFLTALGVDFSVDWHWGDTEKACVIFNRYVDLKRKQKILKRPVADILIGAFALRFEGLITRNPKDFSGWLPELKVFNPMTEKP